MRLLIEELDEHLPLGWVLLRRTPNTDPSDGFIEMHFTGDVDLRESVSRLERIKEAAEEIVDGEEHYKGKESANDYDATIEAICEQLRDALHSTGQK